MKPVRPHAYKGWVSDLTEKGIGGLAQRLGVELAPVSQAPLLQYAQLAERWGRKLDLTSAREPNAHLEVLLADAMVLADVPELAQTGRVLDVGAGVGAPTLPLLLLREGLSADLVEPRRKRVAFLRAASAGLGLLQRVAVHETRIETGGAHAPGAPHRLALSRATFKAPVWLELGLRLAPQVVVMAAAAELPAPPPGASLEVERAYVLPFSGAPRKLGLYLRD